MRDLINIITEKSRGLLYRKTGDQFFQGDLNNPTAVITFDKAEYYPGMPGAYDSYEEMAAVGKELYKQYPAIEWFNKPGTANRAFAILSFDGPGEGQRTYFGKFFNEIKPDMQGFWKNNELPGGWQLNKASSLKGAYFQLKPSDIFPPNATFDTPADILVAMKGQEKLAPLMAGMNQLLTGELPRFEGQKQMATAITDDLGETVGPIALVQGMITSQGAEAARVDILGPSGSWAGSKINFPASKTNGLVDSYLYTPEGIEVGLSSKADKGATASIKNVKDGIDIARKQNTTDVLDKYKEQVTIIEEVGQLSSRSFPLVYGIRYDFINKRQAELIDDLIKVGAKELSAVTMSPDDRAKLEELMGDISPTPNPRYNVGYHVLASLARRVVDVINKDKMFGEACLTFLNISPIIQLHLQSRIEGEDVVVTGFTSKYPPNFKGTVALDASKVYYATGTNGRATFAYNGGGENIAEPPMPTEPVAKPAAVTGKRVDIRPDAVTKPKKQDLGRERR